MSKEYLETLGKNIRYKKEYIGAGLYRLYIKRNDIELLEQSLQRLESIDNAKPSEALRALDRNIVVIREKDFTIIQQALLKPDKNEKIILGIEDYINRRIEIEPIEDVRKAFIEIRKQLQVIKEVANNE